MAFFDFVLDESSAGALLEPADGFIVDLKMTTPPIAGQPAWDPVRKCFVRGIFCLRGDEDCSPLSLRNLICVDLAANPIAAFGSIWRDRSEPYKGRLLVESIPKGARFELRLSDIPNVRAAAHDPERWRAELAERVAILRAATPHPAT
jgi:hypothetical protein